MVEVERVPVLVLQTRERRIAAVVVIVGLFRKIDQNDKHSREHLKRSVYQLSQMCRIRQ